VIEDLVRRCPSQYIWSYNRYKTPRALLRRRARRPGFKRRQTKRGWRSWFKRA
jgi:hypothetical protein